MVLTQWELSLLAPFVKTTTQRRRFLVLCALSYVERPVIPDIRYNLNALSYANALLDFRFDVMGIKKLGYLLGLPAVVITTQRYCASLDEAMCILLGRLAFPTRFHTMTQTLGRSRAALSSSVQWTQAHPLPELLRPLTAFASASTAPSILRMNGLLEYLSQRPSVFSDCFIYGDPAYGISRHLLSGFKGVDLSGKKREFNKWMSRVRQAVEWNFMIMKSLWAFIT
ncbi:hypothetical protein H257_01007 [Aphanomyces astaci]|uniref:DDE Tnp4 domain-containing protein n=1 Tax=Aphanomyces astaci TaxID=112090 RepID=W4H5X7_APHAT|nr:hypothetical protein H257_01007 [Aphanomyces astaci]ETV87425.1 hypothetical protein H257_01007 [Aphanomyces astaci]|eukprot:XP_009822288.1 hypothetical protein H257_01007 [Aphanomyces astaci]